jgi:hypothetical protein
MPYKSSAQRAYLHIHEPEIAKRWDKEYGGGGKLPKHVKRKSQDPGSAQQYAGTRKSSQYEGHLDRQEPRGNSGKSKLDRT